MTEVRRTHGRTNVQTVTWLVRDPVLVHPDELLHELDYGLAIERLDEGKVSCLTPLRSEESSRTGIATRAAVLFMRFMFMSGRKSRGLPSGPAYAYEMCVRPNM